MFFPSYHLFFFNDTATTEIYTLSLHDALPIYLLLRARALAALPALRVGRAVAARVGGALRPQLHLHGTADDDADREHLRPLLGGRALGLDLLRPPGGLGAGRGGGRLDLRVGRALLSRV